MSDDTTTDPAMALRTRAVVTRMEHVACVRVSGAHAFELLDRLSTAALFLLDGQVRQSLFLADDGRPIADVYIAKDDRDFFVMAEGLGAGALCEHLMRHATGPHATRLDAHVEDLTRDHALVAVNGPFAWEVVAAMLGPEVIGVPYLSFYRASWGAGQVVCFRAGKTGEYGYDLLVPRAKLDAIEDELVTRGRPLGLVPAPLAVLDAAAIEAWFFNVRALSSWRGATLTPVELQLMWRVARQREFVGAAAVEAHRLTPRVRVTSVTAEHALRDNDVVRLGDTPIGAILASAPSAARGDIAAIAVLDRAWAWSGIDLLTAGPERVPLRTRTPPLLANRSLFVDPHRHSALAAESYPPLVPEVLR